MLYSSHVGPSIQGLGENVSDLELSLTGYARHLRCHDVAAILPADPITDRDEADAYHWMDHNLVIYSARFGAAGFSGR